MTTKSYRIIQDGMPVVGVDGAKNEAEIMHYAHQYAEDGPLTVDERSPKTGRWKVICRMFCSMGINADDNGG